MTEQENNEAIEEVEQNEPSVEINKLDGSTESFKEYELEPYNFIKLKRLDGKVYYCTKEELDSLDINTKNVNGFKVELTLEELEEIRGSQDTDEDKLKAQKKQKLKLRKDYLKNNDWQAIRFIETAQEIPDITIENKMKARVEIDIIGTVATLEELNAISDDYLR